MLWIGAMTVPAIGFDWPRIERDPRSYLCALTDHPPTIDGQLDDPVWAESRLTEDFVDIQGDLRPKPALRTRVQMAWDRSFLYIAARLDDPHVWGTLTERDAVIYHDLDFEVFIDPDGDNHLYYELEINALGTEWDLLLVKPYRDGGPAINAWDIQGLRTAVQVQGTLNDPTDTDTGWTVEIAIPWDVMAQAAGRPAPPEGGDTWRMNFSRVHWWTDVVDGKYVKRKDPDTGRVLPEENWVWSPQGLIAMHCPEMWGRVHFVESRDDRPDDTDEFAVLQAETLLLPVYYRQMIFHEQHGRFVSDAEELGLEPDRLPGWPYEPDAPSTVLLPEGTEFSLDGDGTIWLARLTTPRFTLTVDHEGRIRKEP